MPIDGKGLVPFPDHRRVAQAGEPELLHPIPMLHSAQENADQVLDRTLLTLNRAGSDRRNPILSGLGLELQIPLGSGDGLTGLFVYQRHALRGPNLRDQALPLAPGVFGLEVLVGGGLSKAGTPSNGPVANYVRVETARGGAFEKLFYAQEHDYDAVVLDGKASLDPDTLEAVEIVLEIVDGSRPWLDVPVDFFTSWNDAFLRLHRADDTEPERGFAKAYGGSKFVSFFDATPGTEGVGVQVNPINQSRIESRRTIQVQNTTGVKNLIARFRSRQDSPFFVDVPITLRLVDLDEVCRAPATEPCSDVFFKAGATIPAGYPTVASQPDTQVTAGPGSTASEDLLMITVRGAAVGGDPRVHVRRWKYITSGPKLAGVAMALVGDDLVYKPLVMGASSPVEDPPYQAPKRLTIAMSKAQLHADLVAWLEVIVVDGLKPGKPVLIPGPRARDIQFTPIGTGGVGTGGGPVCAY